jgi:hypothetical protein
MNEAVVGTWWEEKTRPRAPFGLRGGDRFRPGAKGVARGKRPRIDALDDRQCNLRDRGSIPRTSTSLGPHSSKGGIFSIIRGMGGGGGGGGGGGAPPPPPHPPSSPTY